MDGRDLSAHRIALVVNPVSGGGRATRLTSAIAQRLGVRASVRVHEGASAHESAQLLAAVAGIYDAVVVLGGDGIVHLAMQVLAQGDTPLGIIPAGTGNDLAAALGLPAEPLDATDAVLSALESGSISNIDLGRTDAGTWWSTVLCAGFDAAVNERANRMRWPLGPRRYDLAIAAEVARLAPRRFVLGLDDRRLDIEATLIAVGNAPQYGGGKRIAPTARLDDGYFAVTVVGPVSRTTLLRLARTLPHGGHVAHSAVSTYRARTVSLSALDSVAYADGEPIGALPLSTTCVPSALAVLVPDRVADDTPPAP